MDRNYLVANPGEVERSRSEALAAGEAGVPVLTLLERIEGGSLELYFLPNRRAQDVVEVTQALGPFPSDEAEAEANCRRLRLLAAAAGGEDGRDLACTLTQFGPNDVFIIQDPQSQGPTELTFFHLRRGPDQLLVLAARLQRQGALAHTSSIREFIASIRFPQ